VNTALIIVSIRHHLTKNDPKKLLLSFVNANAALSYTSSKATVAQWVDESTHYEKTLVAWFKSNLLLNIQMYNMSLLHKSY
jgi:hypothetical protein